MEDAWENSVTLVKGNDQKTIVKIQIENERVNQGNDIRDTRIFSEMEFTGCPSFLPRHPRPHLSQPEF